MLLTLIISLFVIAVILYAVEIMFPLDVRLKQLIYLLIGLYVVLWLLVALGIEVPILGPLVR